MRVCPICHEEFEDEDFVGDICYRCANIMYNM